MISLFLPIGSAKWPLSLWRHKTQIIITIGSLFCLVGYGLTDLVIILVIGIIQMLTEITKRLAEFTGRLAEVTKRKIWEIFNCIPIIDPNTYPQIS